MNNIFGWRTGTIGLACGALISCGSPSGFDDGGKVSPNTYLSRTASILRSSNTSLKPTFKVLFYGQSITSTKWTDKAASHLINQYPNVNFVFKNMAIGGNDAALLERAVSRDIKEEYPDLVIFHVYGDHRAYERIIRQIRINTSAEVIVQTDHVRSPLEPVCPVGLRMTIDRPEGCKGTLWLRQKNWDNYMSGHIIPIISSKYHVAIDNRRSMWASYLRKNNLPAVALLQDGLHPNQLGWRVAANLFVASFNKLVNEATARKVNYVRDHAFRGGPRSSYKLIGNRFEIIANEPLSKTYFGTVDNVPTRQVPGCWLATRTTPVPWMPDWPAIRQIGTNKLVLEKDEWHIVIRDLSKDAKRFKFDLYSVTHGYDGSGSSQQRFVSKSGSVVIEPEDWAFDYAQRIKPQRLQGDIKVSWSRNFICGGASMIRGLERRSVETRYVVATDLTNGKHEVTINVAPEDLKKIKSIRSFQPPLS